ncbi:MAG: hypothetical protein ACKV2Q_14930 [Planctomycetaceae bacterium]
MNGFKRASRRQAAVVGLALLMGTTFLGCHAGPRLFSKKDRDLKADKQELAEKDKGKFINRKKARPESDYRREEYDEDDDERVVRSETKSKSKTKPSDSVRKPTNDDSERAAGNLAAARRKQLAEEPLPSRSSKSATATAKNSKPAEQTPLARRDPNKRPVTDLLDDSLFDEKLPDTRPSAPSPVSKKSSPKSTATAKANPLEEDPFKNVVSAPPSTKRPTDKLSNNKPPNDKVATVNFDDEELDLGLDDEMEEEAEEARELAEAKAAAEALAAKKRAAATKPTAPQREQQATPRTTLRTTPPTATAQRKFLDEAEEAAAEPFAIDEQIPPVKKTVEKVRTTQPTVKRTSEAAKTVAGQSVVDRRQSVQKTVDDWRREMDRDELAEPEPEPVAPAPRTTARASNPTANKGHLSPASLDEFTPPTKSQGAVLNGELIIDTNAPPNRFQRNSTSPPGTSGATGKTNPNTGANIEIIPGATQNRPRSGGQISLQSSADADDSPGLTTADYEQPSVPGDLGSLPSLKMDSDLGTGPKLAGLEVDSGMAPPPPVFAELAPAIGAAEPPSSGRGWKRMLMALGSIASAIAIGFAWRRRMQLTAAPSRMPTSSPSSERP